MHFWSRLKSKCEQTGLLKPEQSIWKWFLLSLCIVFGAFRHSTISIPVEAIFAPESWTPGPLGWTYDLWYCGLTKRGGLEKWFCGTTSLVLSSSETHLTITQKTQNYWVCQNNNLCEETKTHKLSRTSSTMTGLQSATILRPFHLTGRVR